MDREKVLIVDDSDFDRELLKKVLVAKGVGEVIEARSGRECLDLLAKEPISLVLLDVLMPESSGIDILKEIRKTRGLIELPVIMITAKNESNDVVEALRLGANDYVAKPINFEVAMSRIKAHLLLLRSSREMAKLREISALQAMVTTYNHEINNPLAIAVGAIEGLPDSIRNEPAIKKIETAIWRIADIVRKTNEAVKAAEISYSQYSESDKKISLK